MSPDKANPSSATPGGLAARLKLAAKLLAVGAIRADSKDK